MNMSDICRERRAAAPAYAQQSSVTMPRAQARFDAELTACERCKVSRAELSSVGAPATMSLA